MFWCITAQVVETLETGTTSYQVPVFYIPGHYDYNQLHVVVRETLNRANKSELAIHFDAQIWNPR